LWIGGGVLYPVSETFLQAVQKNTRKYYWTGKITTKAGAEYPFGYEDIVKGSGYITAQCCGNTEIGLGTVYAAEMGITLFSQIDRYTLEDAKVELFYHLRRVDGRFEEVPMGIFEVSEANWTVHCLELKAYDYMLRFEKNFNGFETVGNVYAFLALCCKACDVELAYTQAEVEAMPNGAEVLSVYSENDIEIYQDVLHFIAQVLGGFFCINREGKLELQKYGDAPVMEIQSKHRFNSSFSDFITKYTAVSSTNLRTETVEYYALGIVKKYKSWNSMIYSFYRSEKECYTMNIINVAPFDELVSLINNLSDEKSKRILLSKAADVYGNGGKAHIVELTGITYPTLIAGKADSKNDEVIFSNRIRRKGARRKPTTKTYPNITEAIEKIIDGNTYGDPSKELHWVASSSDD